MCSAVRARPVAHDLIDSYQSNADRRPFELEGSVDTDRTPLPGSVERTGPCDPVQRADHSFSYPRMVASSLGRCTAYASQPIHSPLM